MNKISGKITEYEMVLIARFIAEGKLIPNPEIDNEWILKDDKCRREFCEELAKPLIEQMYDELESLSFIMKA